MVNPGSGQGGTPSGGTTVIDGGDTSYKVSEATKAADEAMKAVIDATPADKTEFTDEEIAAIVDAYGKYEQLSDEEKLFAKNYKEFEEKVLSKLGKDLHYDEPTKTDARDNSESLLPWHVRIDVSEPKLTDEQLADIREVLGDDANLDSVRVIGYTDILTGKEYDPSGLVKIKIPAEGIADGRTVVLIREKADGTFEYLEGKVSKGILTVMSDKSGPLLVFDSSLTWDEIMNGKQPEAPAKSKAWLYAAGGAGLLLIGLILLKRRKKEEDD